MIRRGTVTACGLGALCMTMPGCAPTEPNELDKLGTVLITIKGQPFQLWIADDSEEQARGQDA